MKNIGNNPKSVAVLEVYFKESIDKVVEYHNEVSGIEMTIEYMERRLKGEAKDEYYDLRARLITEYHCADISGDEAEELNAMLLGWDCDSIVVLNKNIIEV